MINTMRSGFFIMLLVTIIFSGGYLYNFALAVCPIPLEYRIGRIDDEFALSLDEAKVAIAEATELWESATGQNLFSYDDDADFTVNFIFDERQEFINEEENFSEKLEVAENINDALTETYGALVAEYNQLKLAYADKVEQYERRLATYNSTVEQYNEGGGAPPDVYERLETERTALDQERSGLDQLSTELDGLVAEINNLGEKGNTLIENYNENIGTFNERYGQLREFTQGEFTTGEINIYTYQDEAELTTVLAHEFGHALSLEHVEGESSVMYYLIGDQPTDLVLSNQDLAEFNRVCGDMSIWDKIVYRLST